jgi:ABC-2 type transport system ATP-binding protein
MSEPLLRLVGLEKTYSRGLLRRQITFRLKAELDLAGRQIIGVVGPNGAGKTTLFEMMTGSNQPSAGRVLVAGRDIHRVKYGERDRLAVHYHQSYQVRRFTRRLPSFLMEPAGETYPLVHLFDEPQFNTQDGYIGFMLDFFRRLRDDGRLVVLCLHPTARYHLQILREVCEGFLFVSGGGVTRHADFADLLADPRVRNYLGSGMTQQAEGLA